MAVVACHLLRHVDRQRLIGHRQELGTRHSSEDVQLQSKVAE